MGCRVEMEGRKEGRVTSPGEKTRATLTYPDKSVTIATLKRHTGSRRVEPRKERCMYYTENVEERSGTATGYYFSSIS